MFFKTKITPPLDEEAKHEKELFEHAQARIKEKKALYRHFIFFLVGCIFMIVLNVVLKFGTDIQFFELDWFVFGVLFWAFFVLVHTFRVVLFSKFMGKEWRDKQTKYLIEKQKAKIAKMEQKLDLHVPQEVASNKQIILDNTDSNENQTLQ